MLKRYKNSYLSYFLMYNFYYLSWAVFSALIPVDISHILGNLITVIFDYQILRKPLKILSL